METKIFLKLIAKYTLVNHGFLKRVYSRESLRDIKTLIKDAERQGLIERNEFKGFNCFVLTEAGFKAIAIDHAPKYRFDKHKALGLCFANHLRYGISEELEARENIDWYKWVSGSKFAKEPLIARRSGQEEKISPEGLLIVKDSGELYRLRFIHQWRNPEQIKRDLFLYYLYEKSERHLDRFYLPEGTTFSVLCLISDFDVLKQAGKYLKRDKMMETALFLPFSRTRLDDPLSSKIWFDIRGKKRSAI